MGGLARLLSVLLRESVRRHRRAQGGSPMRRSIRLTHRTYRPTPAWWRMRGGRSPCTGRAFEQAPVRPERAHHEPDPAGPVGRRRCSAADRVRRIRVRDVPRHSLDNGPPPGQHGADRFRGGRPAPGPRRHGGELVAPGRRRSVGERELQWSDASGSDSGAAGRGRRSRSSAGSASGSQVRACGRGAGSVPRRAPGRRSGRGSG